MHTPGCYNKVYAQSHEREWYYIAVSTGLSIKGFTIFSNARKYFEVRLGICNHPTYDFLVFDARVGPRLHIALSLKADYNQKNFFKDKIS
jgi:hypothetical protein